MTTTWAARQTARLMVDHPGWFTTPDGQALRAFRSNDTVWTMTCRQSSEAFESKVEVVHQGVSGMDTARVVDCFDPVRVPSPFQETPLIRDYGRLYRIRSTNLWESLLPPLTRYRGDTAQSISRYRALCSALGDRVTTPLGTFLTPPRASTVACAADSAWGDLLHKPWARNVRAAAEMYLACHEAWAQLPPDALFHAVCDTPGIAKRSAAAVIADYTNDFSRFEFVEFGTVGLWEQFSHDLDGTFSVADFQAAWNVLTRDQRSILTALSIDRRLHEHKPAQARLFR